MDAKFRVWKKMSYTLAGQKTGQIFVSGQKTEANAALEMTGLFFSNLDVHRLVNPTTINL